MAAGSKIGESAEDDGSDVIALARAVGLPGIRPAAEEQPATRSAREMGAPGPHHAPNSSDDGSDIVALARAVGLAGIRPAFEAPPSNTARPSGQHYPREALAKEDGSDVIALARAVGLSVIRPASEPSSSGDHQNASAQAERGSRATKEWVDRTTDSPSAGPSDLFVEFQLFGGTGSTAKNNWEKEHGPLAADGASGNYWLERRTCVSSHIIFRAPPASADREGLRRVAGNIDRSAGFRLMMVRTFDRSAYQFKGPGAVVGNAQDREPPLLPAHIIAALVRRS